MECGVPRRFKKGCLGPKCGVSPGTSDLSLIKLRVSALFAHYKEEIIMVKRRKKAAGKTRKTKARKTTHKRKASKKTARKKVRKTKTKAKARKAPKKKARKTSRKRKAPAISSIMNAAQQ